MKQLRTLRALACGLALPLALLAMHGVHAGLLDAASRAPIGSSPVPPADRRGAEQTYLTFPEWFLVHSPAEYADWVRTHTPTEFPFLGHVRQFWQGYAKVAAAASEGYPFNFGYHVMIVVIGTSTTLEYGLRSAYETLVGRVSEATQTHGLTPEDRYAARVAQSYVEFIRVRPWYEFDFAARLVNLWRATPLFGPDLIRKWERRYALTTEYAAKAAYGWLIGLATRASYDEAAETTVVVLDVAPDVAPARFKLIARLSDGGILASLPRYQAFTDAAAALAAQGVDFREIAGNRGQILLSALTGQPPGTQWPEARLLFEQPILTRPGVRRMALVVRVPQLSEALRALAAQGVTLEHIYDY